MNQVLHLRLVFDHSLTSIALNTGLISTLLICLGLFVLSTEEYTSEAWDKDIKIIAEVATTNLKMNGEVELTGAKDVESGEGFVWREVRGRSPVCYQVRTYCRGAPD